MRRLPKTTKINNKPQAKLMHKTMKVSLVVRVPISTDRRGCSITISKWASTIRMATGTTGDM